MIKAGAYFLKTTLTNIPSGTYSFYGNLKIGGMTVGGASDLGRVRCSTDMVEVSQTSDSSQIISAFAILYSGGWAQPTYKSWVFSADYDTSTNGYNMNFELWFVENIASSLVLEVTDVDGMKLLTKDRAVYHDIVVTPKLEKQTFTPDKNGKTLTPTTGYCGLGEVAVAPIPDSYVIPEGNVNITENGVVNVKSFETATVDVETTVVEEVLGYEKNVSGDTVDFSLSDTSIVDKLLTGDYTEFYNDTATKLETRVFSWKENLTSVTLTACESIGAEAFYCCVNLTTINLPACKRIGADAFYEVGATSITLPSCTTIDEIGMEYAVNLTTLNLPACTYMGDYALSGNHNLMALYLLAPTVCQIENANVLQNTPMDKNTYTGSYGTIYVPANLLDAYKADSVWATYADRFVGV